MKTKRTLAVENLPPVARAVLEVFVSHCSEALTANDVAALVHLPVGTVTPRMAELDERGYGFIKECPPVNGGLRKQKCWRYRGDHSVLFNVDRHGRVRRKLDYHDLWMRERGARERLVAKAHPKK